MKHQETTSQQYNFSIIKHGDISTPQGFAGWWYAHRLTR